MRAQKLSLPVPMLFGATLLGATLLAAMLLGGCGGRTVGSGSDADAAVDAPRDHNLLPDGFTLEGGQDDMPPRDVTKPPPLPPVRVVRFPIGPGTSQIDVLFVIDNSGSMANAQTNLLGATTSLVNGLRSPALGPDSSGRPCTFTDRTGCQLPDLRIGVISTDLGAGNYGLPSCELTLGDRGKLQNQPRVAGCQTPTDPYIAYSPTTGTTNVPGASGDPAKQIKDALTCIGRLGTGGCGFEQPLESMRRALDPALNVNPGFLRPNAVLAVLVLSDEDDCSAARQTLYDPSQQALSDPLGPLTSFRCFEFGVTCDINDRNVVGTRKNCVPSTSGWLFDVKTRYIDFLRQLKPSGNVVFSLVGGPTTPVSVGKDGNNPVLKSSCTSSWASAVPAIRTHALVDALKPFSSFTSICQTSYVDALRVAADAVVPINGLRGACLTSPLLTDTGGLACKAGDTPTAGVTCGATCLERADCHVAEIRSPGTAQETRALMQRCPTNLFNPKDWRAERDCGTTCPCWRIVSDRTRCPTDSPYYVDIVRKVAPPVGTAAEIQCKTPADPWGSAGLSALAVCK